MTWMNESEVKDAVQRFTRDLPDPVLGPAALFLLEFMEEVNRHSDGWPYWKAPAHAAGKLMALLHGHLNAGLGCYPELSPATPADVKRCMTPIKAFLTRRGVAAGMDVRNWEGSK